MKPGLTCLLLLLQTLGVCRAERASEFPENPPNPAAFARAVNYYVALGEGPGIRALKREAGRGNITLEWLGPALFEPKADGVLRLPAYREISEPYTAGHPGRFPLYPIVRSGKSYFMLDRRIILGDTSRYEQAYLEYFRAHGPFRTQRLPVPTRAEAIHDARALRRSAAWRGIRWKGKFANGVGWDYSEAGSWKEILEQANAVQEP